MALVPLLITGGTYTQKSKPLSAQVTRNFWPKRMDDNAPKSPYVLESWVGLKNFASIAGSRDRGMAEHLGTLYKVTDTTLYSVDATGTETTLGTIPGTGRAIIEGIGSSVVIVTDGVPYVWNGSTLTTVTDGDLETPNAAAHINNQIIYDGDGGRFVSSDVGDATSINGLNYATAESDADDIVRPWVFNQTLYLFGDKTIEPWWNSGVGNPPFDRIENATIQVGLAAIYSVANTKDFTYFLGDDKQVHALNGVQTQPVTTDALAREFAAYSLVSDAHAISFNLEGQWFYVITFPTANKTWVYPEGGEWFEWSSGTEGGKSRISSYAFFAGKHLVGDSESGNIYELDRNTYTEDGETIVRIRDTGPLHGGLFQRHGKPFQINRLELIMETGVGLLSGQGQNPKIVLQISNDGGRTFSEENAAAIGKSGEFQLKVEWHNLGQFEEAIFRFEISDPVFCSIHWAAADIEFGI